MESADGRLRPGRAQHVDPDDDAGGGLAGLGRERRRVGEPRVDPDGRERRQRAVGLGPGQGGQGPVRAGRPVDDQGHEFAPRKRHLFDTEVVADRERDRVHELDDGLGD